MGGATVSGISLSQGARMETESSLPPTRPPALDDQQALVESARRGDPSAHRALYDTHVERVYRLTYRLAGRDDMARELTQDTFVRAFAGLAGYRGDCAFGTWLHTIAVSVTLNELKRRKRQRMREAPLDDAMTITHRTPVRDPLLRDRLAEAVNALPEGCRAVFMMHDAEGFTHDEIGAALGISAGTSKAQLSRARAKLRIALAGFEQEWKS
jgi:RNA polymerase sigma-70 factor, ECF subfamily